MATEQEQLLKWTDTLYRMLGEMETANGDPPQGGMAPKLECLVRFAWEEALDESRRNA